MIAQRRTWQRLTTTPMRDLLRGRVTGRLDWPARLAAAGLPADVAGLVTRVVRRTRLWRLERAAVADELVAHFADAVAAGATDAVAAFGDERTAAKLIGRAKRRNRSPIGHAWTWAWRATAGLVVVYVGLLLAAVFGRPRVAVDYVAQLAAPARAVPESDRAWPLWREAILACEVFDSGSYGAPDVIEPSFGGPTDPVKQAAWLAAHADGLATARRAAAKPALGFVIGPGGTAAVDPMFHNVPPEAPGEPTVDVLLPHLNSLRAMAEILAVDLSRAADAGDGTRVEADAVAMHGLAAQLRRSDAFLVTQLVGLGVDVMAVDRLGAVVADRPAVLPEAALGRLAHTFAGPEVAADLLDLSGDRAMFADAVQRMYTDDGHGDGRMTWAGLKLLPWLCAVSGPQNGGHAGDEAFAVPFVAASRATVTATYDRLIAESRANLARPRRLADWTGPAAAAAKAWTASPVDRVRFAALAPFAIAFAHEHNSAERYLGSRDGLLVGLALEASHRRHGTYPATLGDLVPELLPAVPADRITGGPVRYRVVNGKPVVYSVGADRTDDGGRRPVDRVGHHTRDPASWDAVPPATPPADWVLFPPAPSPLP